MTQKIPFRYGSTSLSSEIASSYLTMYLKGFL